jgi:hypothetical protein
LWPNLAHRRDAQIGDESISLARLEGAALDAGHTGARDLVVLSRTEFLACIIAEALARAWVIAFRVGGIPRQQCRTAVLECWLPQTMPKH